MPDEIAAPAAAKAWVLPIPYEATASYGAGTREGPDAIITASRQVELFDREFDCEPAMRVGVHTMNAMEPVCRSPEDMIAAVEQTVAEILAGPPAPEMLAILGGEHSISAGAARGMARAGMKDFVTVHVDAHADLRDTYEGTPYSHACAARRIAEVSPVFQIGIRNISEDGARFLREGGRVQTVFFDDGCAERPYLDELAGFVHGKTVYLTIDLDGLDPSIMPAVGTPEPGGLSWADVMAVVRTVCRGAARLPIFDVVELAPIPAVRGPDFLAAKLMYKIIALALLK